MNIRPLQAVLALVLCATMALQTYLLYAPVSGPSGLPPWTDKIVHAGMFGGPALLVALGGWRHGLLALTVYAPISEMVQTFVGRDGAVLDVLADWTGIALLGLGLGRALRGKLLARSRGERHKTVPGIAGEAGSTGAGSSS